MANWNYVNRKETIKEGTLEYQDWRKNKVHKNIGKYSQLSFELSDSCLPVEAKIITLMWFCKYGEEIVKTVVSHMGKGKGT